MKILSLILLIVALCGCGNHHEEPADNNHGFGNEFDVQGASGLKLKYSPLIDPVSPFANVQFYENGFSLIQGCMGATAPAPFIIIVPTGTLGRDSAGGFLAGVYLENPSLIVVDSNIFFFKRAIVHHILLASTGNSDPEETSPLFIACADLLFVPLIP